MKALLAPALLLFQMAVAAGPVADPVHLLWQRPVIVPVGATGSACAVLDARVFAHAASRSLDDMRLYAQPGTAEEIETPFALTENAAVPVEADHPAVSHLKAQGAVISFDLAMPSRPYSEVDLDLAAKDFVAMAHVTGSGPSAPTPVDLGTFTLFDLGSQHLSRSTALPLEEATLATLHVRLQFATPDGKSLVLPASVVKGAEVPPSRLAQTLYTPVARSTDVQQVGESTLMRFHVPAHVPVERATVVLDPGFHDNFVRKVTVADTAQVQDTGGSEESVEGQISRENLDSPKLENAPAIHQEHLSVDAVLAANLRQPAVVTVSIFNGKQKPLPVRAVELEMRQRRICFDAAPQTTYTLRYGDAALRAPFYDYARLFDPNAPAGVATLGPEQRNPRYRPRPDTRSYSQRHPEVLWVVLFGFVAVLGAILIGTLKHQRRTF